MSKIDNTKAALEMLNEHVEYRGGYAYRAEETRLWYAVTHEEVEELAEMLADGTADAYSLWCTSAGEEISDVDHDALDALIDAGAVPEHVAYRCQCGAATQLRCEWTGPRTELHKVRYVHESDRGSARASGTYTRGGYAVALYVAPTCADMLTHVYNDEGEQTDELDEFARDCGPAYA